MGHINTLNVQRSQEDSGNGSGSGSGGGGGVGTCGVSRAKSASNVPDLSELLEERGRLEKLAASESFSSGQMGESRELMAQLRDV